MTQRALAEQIGVSHNTISQWENATNAIDIDVLHKVCLALEITFNEIFGKFTVANSLQLTKDEDEFVKNYRQLSDQGQEYMRQTMHMALQTYKKHSGLSDMEVAEEAS